MPSLTSSPIPTTTHIPSPTSSTTSISSPVSTTPSSLSSPMRTSRFIEEGLHPNDTWSLTSSSASTGTTSPLSHQTPRLSSLSQSSSPSPHDHAAHLQSILSQMDALALAQEAKRRQSEGTTATHDPTITLPLETSTSTPTTPKASSSACPTTKHGDMLRRAGTVFGTRSERRRRRRGGSAGEAGDALRTPSPGSGAGPAHDSSSSSPGSSPPQHHHHHQVNRKKSMRQLARNLLT